SLAAGNLAAGVCDVRAPQAIWILTRGDCKALWRVAAHGEEVSRQGGRPLPTELRRSEVNTQILEEAAEWLVELSSGEADSDARERFDAWVRKSPEHLRAYLELLPVWEDGALLPAGNAMTVDELIAFGRRAEG